MIITTQKDFKDILKSLEREKKVFIVGCGECATVCKTGGEEEVLKIKKALEQEGKVVTGWVVPEAPCVASQVRIAAARNKKAMREADAILVMACGLGVQSVRENDREGKIAHTGCDTLFMGEVDKDGAFLERCSACGECILEETGGICAITRCPKGLINGPCGGTDKGKCEVDKDRDCVWTLIYKALKEKNRLDLLKKIQPPKDYSKMSRPRQLSLRPCGNAKSAGPENPRASA